MGTSARAGEFVGAVIALVVLYKALLWMERRGWSSEILTIVFGLLLIESLLWDQNSVPVGLFHPRLLGQNFRLYDILIPVALLARWRARRPTKRISLLGFAVALFCVWYACCAIVGLVGHNGLQNVLFQAKLVIYMGGGYALSARVPAEDILGRRGLQFLCRPLAVYILFPVFITKSGVPPDAATIIVSLGLITLLVEVTSQHPRLTMIMADIVLLISPLGSHQRAALLGLIVSLAVAAVCPFIRSPHRRVRVTPTEILVGLFVLAGSVLSVPLLKGRPVNHLNSYPLGSTLGHVLNSAGKQQSASDRLREIHAMLPLIGQHPIIGSGLATPITYAVAGTSSSLTTTSPDEQYLDFLLRCGAVGMVFFIVVVVIAARYSVRVWRLAALPGIAALAWGSAAAVGGILARAAVEAISEKYRIAVLLGLTLGMIAAAAKSVQSPAGLDEVGSSAPAARESPASLEPVG